MVFERLDEWVIGQGKLNKFMIGYLNLRTIGTNNVREMDLRMVWNFKFKADFILLLCNRDSSKYEWKDMA